MKKILFIFSLFVSTVSFGQTTFVTTKGDTIEIANTLTGKIIVQPEISIQIVGYEVTSTTDNPISKTVISNVNLIANDGQKYDRSGIVVWFGDDYDNIGQWTDTDLNSALAILLKQ
jgi:hypothetical protein